MLSRLVRTDHISTRKSVDSSFLVIPKGPLRGAGMTTLRIKKTVLPAKAGIDDAE
jgi:hypothetical protein